MGSPESRIQRSARGGIEIVNPPEHTGWLDARFVAGRERAGDTVPQRETLTWVAEVQRVGAWYVIADVAFGSTPLLVQATTYGCHVTAPVRADASRWGVTGHIVPLDAGRLSREHRWELARDGNLAALRLDRDSVWRGEVPAALTTIAFGETRSDREHGGTLRLMLVEYTAERE
jgi:hypothetical protein